MKVQHLDHERPTMRHIAKFRLAAGTLLLTVALGAQAESAPTAGQPKELGKVAWIRDHDEALVRSKKTGKPIFLLFQEVPG